MGDSIAHLHAESLSVLKRQWPTAVILVKVVVYEQHCLVTVLHN